MASADWVEANLVRQRKMLEEKQRNRRITTPGVTAVPNSAAVHSDFVFVDPFSVSQTMCFDGPLGQTDDPDRLTLTSSSSRLADLNRVAMMKSGSSRSFKNDSVEEELAAKMEKADMSAVVLSDDDDPDLGWSWFQSLKDSDLGDDVAVNPGRDDIDLPKDDQEPDYDYIINNLEKFVEEPAQAGKVFRCIIARDKKGMDKGIYPTYYLHLDPPESNPKSNRKIFLLAARRRKKCKTANYLISTDATNLSKEGGSFVAKVRANAMGTHFTVYDNGKNPSKTTSVEVRQELAGVLYETNVLGFKGPRKMTVIVPGVAHTGHAVAYKRMRIQPVEDKDTLIERYKRSKNPTEQNMNQIVVMSNKPPIWNDDTQSYVLNFHGRVQCASVKNFQIVHQQDPDYIVMQFGRRNDENFTMDFRYPLSAIQAFGIAMTSFHSKLACE